MFCLQLLEYLSLKIFNCPFWNDFLNYFLFQHKWYPLWWKRVSFKLLNYIDFWIFFWGLCPQTLVYFWISYSCSHIISFDSRMLDAILRHKMNSEDNYIKCDTWTNINIFIYLVTKNKCPGKISVRFFNTNKKS